MAPAQGPSETSLRRQPARGGIGVAIGLALALALSAAPAGAQPKGSDKTGDKSGEPAASDNPDADAMVAVAEALDQMGAGKTDDAIAKLTKRFEGCTKCEASTRALVLTTLGILYGNGKNDLDRARTIFEVAVREDPSVEIDRQYAGKEVGKIFLEAQREAKKTPQGPGKGATRLPPGKSQRDLAAEAKKQLGSGNWSDCMGTLIGAMPDPASEFAEGKLVLARCEEAGGLLLEAGRDVARATELAKAEADASIEGPAKELAEKLDNDTPRIVVLVPASVDGAVIKIDGETYDAEAAKKGVPRNPGKATIEVTGKKAGYPFNYKSTESVDRGEKITVDVSQSAGSQNSAVQQCLANAKTADEVALCLETGGKGRGLTFRGGLEVSSYNDSHAVDAVSPAIKIGFENPTQGWLVGGTAMVDVVSAASPDIVSTASRRFDQARFAGTLGGDVKIGAVRLGASAGVSYENDYTGRSAGALISADVADKRLTPALAYTFGFDTITMANTDPDVFEHELMTHTVDASLSGVLNTTTVLIGGGTFVAELGDQSKPYRHVPMFPEGLVDSVPRGATEDAVSEKRLPFEPGEQLPDERFRGAVAIGLRHRFETATLRLDERGYMDSWGLVASTTEGRFLFDATETTRVGPHLRAHVQSGVGFWERAYTASSATFPLTLPEYRTGDKELGPLFGVTVGGSVRQKVNDVLAFGFAVDGIYTQYLDHIYVFDRWGLFTASTMEVVVE